MNRKHAERISPARHKLLAEFESSALLDSFVRQMIRGEHADVCGVLISGFTGTGKTFVAESFLQQVENHPVLTARHLQQHENIPYFGFKYSLSDYLGKIYNQFSKAELHQFSARMKEYLGDSFPLLVDYIPELSWISPQAENVSQGSRPKIENQLYPLFRKLFEFLADYYKNPVLFFTDDLQWIDASGINLLKYLLLNLSPQKFVWIGATRAPMAKTSLLGQLLEEIHFNGRKIQAITLKGLSEKEVQRFLEVTFGRACQQDLVEVCYQLTDGNPSYLQALVEDLKGTEFLWLENSRWNGDIEAIRKQYSGQNAELILLDSLRKLSPTAQEILCVMACLGRYNERVLLDWLGGSVLELKKILNEAATAGLIEIEDGDVRFTEMHIGEMIYNDLSDTQRLSYNYRIAGLFYAWGLEKLSGTEIIQMATSYNQSLDAVKANQALENAAVINFKAGKISEQDGALDKARYFYNMSAELLKECSWERVAEQVWMVYMERARVEYFLGEYDLAEIHLDYLLERFRDPLKRAKAFELKVTINNHLGRYRKVVLILKEILGELGLELPLDDDILKAEVEKLRLVLTNERDEYGIVQDAVSAEYQEAILKLLYVGGMGMHHTSDVMMMWAALQIIINSGGSRPSVVKAIGYVSYGRMLIIGGSIEKGFGFGTKGLEINKWLDDISLRCRVFGVYAFYIQPWKKPFKESNSLLQEALEAGKKAGDLIGLYILKTHQLNLHLISGLPLTELLQWNFEESYPGMELTYYITHYQKSLIRFLTGDSAVFSMPRQQPSSLAANLTIREEKFYRHYVWARYYFLFGHYDLAAKAAHEAHDNRKLQEASPLLPANLTTWFLSVTQNWLNYSGETRELLKPRMLETLDSFQLWQQHSPRNYRPAWHLLSAEWSRISGNHAEAIAHYQSSVEESDLNIYHRAVTHELWAKYLFTLADEKANALNQLNAAINSFNQWGAVAKSRQLLQQFQAVLSVVHDQPDIDMETIQYELSGDMEVESLVKKLMVLLLRISGSTHVMVELRDESGDRIWYDQLSLLKDAKSAGKQRHINIPVSMILMAMKSENTVVVNDLKTEKGFRDLETIRQRGVQSFLILPVTISGHLSMVIYLENIFASNWYSAERVRWVRIAVNQGAVIIENARIHERSVKLNDEIRREMAEKERLASVIKHQTDEHLKALVQTQDNERKRIARDLHDSLGSLLSSVRLRFNGLQDDFQIRVPEKSSRYNDSIRLLDEAIKELRQISHNMVPVSLSRFGLQSALQSFIEQVNASEQLDISLQILGLETRVSEEMEVTVYRICQELLQNVIKHANATLVRIQIIHHNDSLNIIVDDNGKGMQKDAIVHGFGFNTIQSKVNLFKGTFGIESQPGKGCMILVDLPLS